VMCHKRIIQTAVDDYHPICIDLYHNEALSLKPEPYSIAYPYITVKTI